MTTVVNIPSSIGNPEYYLLGKAPASGCSQHKWPRTRPYSSLALHFGNIPHPRASPIIVNKANVIMNLSIGRSEGI